ncbi:glycosyltransferase [Nakamurella sp. YIM 132087]|uniref:Glycosyltransferase n=1 Tax=Nakamurella alba TaxID=2665158 RepID=A0A7K1FI07_9ACTN|nr:glycosyltransferase [Nakamurella alba]MTD13751.1 glycosyltransferase [Nakamurella alba]
MTGPDSPLVVHVITALGTGGAERQLQWLAHRSGHRSHVIALYGDGPVADAMRADGTTVEVLGMAGAAKLTALPRLVARLRRLRPAVVHVHLLAAQLWGIPAARLAGIRTVVSSEHSLMDTTIENRPLTARLRRIYRRLESWTAHTVAVSSATRDRLLRWDVPADRITVVDNGIDFDALAFDPGLRRDFRAELGIADDVVLIGGIGRLEPVKRFPQLLRALAPDLGPLRQLVLVGAGPLEESLRSTAAELGLGDVVHVLGARGDVRSVLSGLDLLISPSRDETFGMAVVEGVGAGLPVVRAQCPALDELGEDVPGVITLPTDADEKDEAAAILAGSRALAPTDVAPGARRPVPDGLRRRYGIAGVTARIDGLYDTLLAGAARR